MHGLKQDQEFGYPASGIVNSFKEIQQLVPSFSAISGFIQV
jgi:hypothetical protein